MKVEVTRNVTLNGSERIESCRTSDRNTCTALASFVDEEQRFEDGTGDCREGAREDNIVDGCAPVTKEIHEYLRRRK